MYFVTAVGNDTEFMVRLLLMINAQHDKSFTNLVIVDMSRPGPEQFNLTKHRKSLNIPVHYLHLGKFDICINLASYKSWIDCFKVLAHIMLTLMAHQQFNKVINIDFVVIIEGLANLLP